MALWWLLNCMYSLFHLLKIMFFCLQLVLGVCFCAYISRRMALFVMIMRRISYEVIFYNFHHSSCSTCVESTRINSSVIMSVLLAMLCWGLALMKVVTLLQAYIFNLAASVHLEYVFKAEYCRYRRSSSNKPLTTNHVSMSACLSVVVWQVDKCGIPQIVGIRLITVGCLVCYVLPTAYILKQLISLFSGFSEGVVKTSVFVNHD